MKNNDLMQTKLREWSLTKLGEIDRASVYHVMNVPSEEFDQFVEILEQTSSKLAEPEEICELRIQDYSKGKCFNSASWYVSGHTSMEARYNLSTDELYLSNQDSAFDLKELISAKDEWKSLLTNRKSKIDSHKYTDIKPINLAPSIIEDKDIDILEKIVYGKHLRDYKALISSAKDSQFFFTSPAMEIPTIISDRGYLIQPLYMYGTWNSTNWTFQALGNPKRRELDSGKSFAYFPFHDFFLIQPKHQ